MTELHKAIEVAEMMGSKLLVARAQADTLRLQQRAGDDDSLRDTRANLSSVIESAPELADLIDLGG